MNISQHFSVISNNLPLNNGVALNFHNFQNVKSLWTDGHTFRHTLGTLCPKHYWVSLLGTWHRFTREYIDWVSFADYMYWVLTNVHRPLGYIIMNITMHIWKKIIKIIIFLISILNNKALNGKYFYISLQNPFENPNMINNFNIFITMHMHDVLFYEHNRVLLTISTKCKLRHTWNSIQSSNIYYFSILRSFQNCFLMVSHFLFLNTPPAFLLLSISRRHIFFTRICNSQKNILWLLFLPDWTILLLLLYKIYTSMYTLALKQSPSKWLWSIIFVLVPILVIS